ncbi:uncharacterized protein DS421_19g655820 [Arachis hypogaea]|uniref:Uncharacterized protein n=1 Tax=Arachis hypogaea TaxID=3818 RepID=A0A6B9V964_ARAHY|nr:uncharacterized protein DS421_19g655820 [Arachis hypogaea]
MEKTGRESASEEEGAIVLPLSVLSRLRHHQSRRRRLWNRKEPSPSPFNLVPPRLHGRRCCELATAEEKLPSRPVPPSPSLPWSSPTVVIEGPAERENERGSGSSLGRGAMLHATVATSPRPPL